MKHRWRDNANHRPAPTNARAAERSPVTLPARLAWKDQRGISRFASVVTRNVSACGVFVECHSALSIPLYRLVQFEMEPTAHDLGELPESLRQGRILSAVYRISHASQTTRYGLALRLMVDPRRRAVEQTEVARATA